MVELGCQTEATQNQVESMFKQFEDKYQNSITNSSFENLNVQIDNAGRTNVTAERKSAAEAARANGEALSLYSASTRVIRVSRTVTQANGSTLTVTKLLDPCDTSRSYVTINNPSSHLSRGNNHINNESKIQFNLLPIQCVKDDEIFNIRTAMGLSGPPISDLYETSQLLEASYSFNPLITPHRVPGEQSSGSLDN